MYVYNQKLIKTQFKSNYYHLNFAPLIRISLNKVFEKMLFKLCVVLLCVSMVCGEFEFSKQNLLNTIDKFDKEDSVYLFGGLSIVKTKSEEAQRSDARDETLLNRFKRYFECRALKFSVPDERQLEEGMH